MNGLLLLKEVRKSDGTLINSESNDYQSDVNSGPFGETFYGLKIGNFFSESGGQLYTTYNGQYVPWDYNFTTRKAYYQSKFIFAFYPIYSRWQYLKKKTIIQDGQTTVIDYNYDTNHSFLKEQISTTSRGQTTKTVYEYAVDRSGTYPYSAMVSAFQLNSVVKESKYIDNNFTEETNTNYRDFGNGIKAIENVKRKVSGGNEYELLSFSEYSNRGNPIKYLDKGISTRLTWYDGEGKKDLLQNRTVGDGTGVSQTTVYNYNPLVGISSEQDPNGRTLYYSYDNLNRLLDIRENSPGGNLLQSYSYKYAAGGCDQSLPVANNPNVNNPSTPGLVGGSSTQTNLQVTPTALSVSSGGGTYSFTVNSTNVNWSLSNWPAWVSSVTPTSGGNGSTSVSISFQNNGDANPRNGTLTLSGSGVANQTITLSQQGTTPPSGGPNGCYTVQAQHSSKYLQSMGAGQILKQYPANGQTNQLWKFNPLGNGNHRLTSQSSGKVMSVQNGNVSQDTYLVELDDNAQTSQQWKLELVGGSSDVYRLKSPGTSLLADVEGTSTADGAQLHLWTQYGAEGAGNQQWKLASATCPSSGGATLTVSNQTNLQNVASGGGSGSFAIASNVSWSISGAPAWATLTVSSGSGNATVSVSFQANGAATQRTAILTLSGSGVTNQTINLSQQGATSPPGGCVVNRVRFQFRNAGDCCMDRLVGAKIQGSTDQSTWTDLYTFSGNGTGSWQEVTFGNTTSYQYVRFLAGPNGYGEFYELEFYDGSTRLTGTGFGTSGTEGSNGYAAAFDGNTSTQWHGIFPGSGNYAGLQLTGCGGSTPALTVSNQNNLQNVSRSVGTYSFTVNSTNVNWNLSNWPTWVSSVTPASGANGTTTANVTFQANGATTLRNGTITLSGSGVANQTIPLSQLGTTPPSGGPNGCYTVQAQHSSKYLQSMGAGQTLRQYPANGQTNQLWKFDPLGNGTHRLTSQSSGKVMSVQNGNVSQDIYLVELDDNNQSSQQWKLELVSGTSDVYRLKSPGTSLLADVEGTFVSDGAQLHLWSQYGAEGASNQQWKLASATCPSSGGATLSVSNQTNLQNVASSGGSGSFAIASNVSWSISGVPAWASLSVSSGSGNATVSVSFQANGAATSRTAPLTLSGSGIANQTITLFQQGITSGGSGCGSRVQGLIAQFYHLGALSQLPDFTALTPVQTTTPATFDIITGRNGRDEQFGFVFKGYVEIPTTGIYQFFTTSDDGSKLYIDGVQKVNNDGLHGFSEVGSGAFSLAAGCHAIRVEMFENGGGEGLAVHWEGPGIAKDIIPSQRLFRDEATPPPLSGCVVNKVRLKFRGDCCTDRLVGATIEGSLDNQNWTTLYTMNQNATGQWQEFSFGNASTYQRVRFVAGPQGYGELYELEFYHNDTKLNGTFFGSAGESGGNVSANALDGNEGSFWHGNFPGNSNFAGLILSGCP